MITSMDLSIIIPVYNSAATIVEAMDSVVRECRANPYSWELILVDDGSKDNSDELIENYIKSSDYGKCIQLIKQPNGGAAVARNTGIKASQGEFIAFNDSDDRWLEGKLKLQMDYMQQHSNTDLLGCAYAADNFQKGSLVKLSEMTHITIKAQVSKNYFSPPTTILRGKSLEKTGLFNEKLRYAEEGFFFNNMVYHGFCVYMQQSVAEPILKKGRWGDCGLSGNLLKMEQGELFNIRSAYQFHYITFGRYLFAICFSLTKFVRRWLISKYRKICK